MACALSARAGSLHGVIVTALYFCPNREGEGDSKPEAGKEADEPAGTSGSPVCKQPYNTAGIAVISEGTHAGACIAVEI